VFDIPVVIAAYLIGSVPFAVILARQWGAVDLRAIGSGNVGATNVLRAHGVAPGVLVALLDMAKGALSVLLADRLSTGAAAPAAAACAAVIGHVYPVWLGFRGGKGVATACGAFSILTPIAGLVAFGVFAATVWVSRYVSLGSVLASAVLPSVAYLSGSQMSVVAAASATALLVVIRHRTNLIRMRLGTERRIDRPERGREG
jgi:glycerol-3-phosphate acyltransferase PlsY